MWKFSFVFVLFMSFCYANNQNDVTPVSKINEKFSKELSDELAFMGTKLREVLSSENVEINSTTNAHDWQLVAAENNVTVDQLRTIFQFSSKLRLLNFPLETETAKDNITLLYFREACEQYVPAKAETPTLPTTTPSGFWNSIMKAFMKPLAVSIAFAVHVSMFVNATTTTEKLRIFAELQVRDTFWRLLQQGAIRLVRLENEDQNNENNDLPAQ